MPRNPVLWSFAKSYARRFSLSNPRPMCTAAQVLPTIFPFAACLQPTAMAPPSANPARSHSCAATQSWLWAYDQIHVLDELGSVRLNIGRPKKNSGLSRFFQINGVPHRMVLRDAWTSKPAHDGFAFVLKANITAPVPMTDAELASWKEWALAQADHIDPVVSGAFRTYPGWSSEISPVSQNSPDLLY